MKSQCLLNLNFQPCPLWGMILIVLLSCQLNVNALSCTPLNSGRNLFGTTPFVESFVKTLPLPSPTCGYATLANTTNAGVGLEAIMLSIHNDDLDIVQTTTYTEPNMHYVGTDFSLTFDAGGVHDGYIIIGTRDVIPPNNDHDFPLNPSSEAVVIKVDLMGNYMILTPAPIVLTLPASTPSEGATIVTLPDQTYMLVANTTGGSYSGYRPVVAKLNNNLNALWTLEMKPTGFPFDMVAHWGTAATPVNSGGDNGIVFTGKILNPVTAPGPGVNSFIAAIDEFGGIVWADEVVTQFGPENEVGFEVTQVNDLGFVVAGGSNNIPLSTLTFNIGPLTHPLAYKVDLNGILQWGNIYNPPTGITECYARGTSTCASGTTLALAGAYNAAGNPDKSFLTTINHIMGTPSYTKVHASQNGADDMIAHSVAATCDGYVLINDVWGGGLHDGDIIKTDLNGDTPAQCPADIGSLVDNAIPLNYAGTTFTMTAAGTWNQVFPNIGAIGVHEAKCLGTSPTCPYAIRNMTLECVSVGDIVCIWLDAVQAVPSGVIGMDFCLEYDPAFLTPVGSPNTTLGNIVTGGGSAGVYGYIDNANNHVHTTIYYNGLGNFLTAIGEVICIEFQITAIPPAGMPIPVSACEVRESYVTSTLDQCATDGGITLFTSMEGQLIYWDDVSRFIDGTPQASNQTDVWGMDPGCILTGNHFAVDNMGYVTITDPFVDIDRQIIPDDYYVPGAGNCYPVGIGNPNPVITTMDCACLGFITTFNSAPPPICNFSVSGGVPNAFQMIAGDVNMDDKLSAGDVTLIQQRIIQSICEYPQTWNYTPVGTPNSSYAPSKDWRFVDERTVANHSSYNAHTNFPNFPPTSGTGYWRDNVPDIPLCLPTYVDSCYMDTLKYNGVLLGDIDGSWAVTSNLKTETTSKLIVDASNATSMGGNTYSIPIGFTTDEIIYAIDMNMEYDANLIMVQDFQPTAQETVDQFNMAFNVFEGVLLVSSYTLTGSTTENPLYHLIVSVAQGDGFMPEYLGEISALLNGQQCEVIVTGTNSFIESGSGQNLLNVYPNPAKDKLTVQWNVASQAHKSIKLYDLLGRTIYAIDVLNGGNNVEIDLGNLPEGVYMLAAYENGIDVSTTKIVKH